jgi:hypothetical protein
MAKKRDRIAERLAYWRDAIRREKSEDDFEPEFFSRLKERWQANFPPRWPVPPSSRFEVYCQTIGMPNPFVGEAAEFFGLDLKNEAEEAALLTILADVVFNRPAAGRPRQHRGKWNVFRLTRLAVDLEKMKAESPGISDKKATDLLKKKFAKRYRHNSAETIRQNLRAARGWLDNARRIRADRRGRPVE